MKPRTTSFPQHNLHMVFSFGSPRRDYTTSKLPSRSQRLFTYTTRWSGGRTTKWVRVVADEYVLLLWMLSLIFRCLCVNACVPLVRLGSSFYRMESSSFSSHCFSWSGLRVKSGWCHRKKDTSWQSTVFLCMRILLNPSFSWVACEILFLHE